MQSRVGGAAISVPPEVTLNLVDIPKSATRVRGKDVPKFTAEIKGPKGMIGALLVVVDSVGS
jgi:large subunit ribosomal protein L6